MNVTRPSGDPPTEHAAGPTGARFPSPFDVSIPEDCRGWEAMYPYHTLFSDDRRGFDESRFWFHDGVHFPEPLYPFDELVTQCCFVGFSQADARLSALPPSLGAEYRVLNGYAYMSPNLVADAPTLGRRATLFEQRAGYCYEHWDELYARWCTKLEGAISELRALDVPRLPELEDAAIVREGRGWGSSHALLVAYSELLDGLDRVIQYHFELLNLGYAAYVALYELCRRSFPRIEDNAIAALVSGVDVLPLRPDEELRRLARLAVELGVADAVESASAEKDLRAGLAASDAGARWLAELDSAKEPWFSFSYGNGMYHHHRSWIDDTTLPITTIGSYVERIRSGHDISRPLDALVAERERTTARLRSLLDAERRPAFDDALALARQVFPYVENHNFYVEHRYLTLFWNKVRGFGARLAEHGFLTEPDDVFYLRSDEVRSALQELRAWWAAGGVGAPRGPSHWPPTVARRKSILEAMRRWDPPPALGAVPEAIGDPGTVMLWGITTERVRQWLGSAGGARQLKGIACSPGVAEGRARVILAPEQLGQLQYGEVLVAPSTSPSWTPVFSKLAAAVLDVGGIMSHAAIVAREYALPAVAGTGNATQLIKTGDRVRVDGDAGTVTILDR
jgi:pyruvate,water dikinase